MGAPGGPAMPTGEVITQAVHLACRAPSIHNSQPWQWRVEGKSLHLHLDRDRLVDTDTSGRQALISCGAVLDHLKVAMAVAGWTSEVEYYPHTDDRTHLAAVRFTPSHEVTSRDRARADAVLRRRTDRLPFAAPPTPGEWDTWLRDAAAGLAHVDLLEEAAYPQLAEASQLTETLRLYDSAYHAELQWWTAPFGITDGIPQSSLVSAAESDRVAVGRTFPVTRHTDRRQEVPEDRGAVLVLTAVDDTPLDVLRCGEALSAVLLEATMVGLATCTLTHLTELADGVGLISAMTGRPFPQALIRVGLAPSVEAPSPPTPRRVLADVLTFTLPAEVRWLPGTPPTIGPKSPDQGPFASSAAKRPIPSVDA